MRKVKTNIALCLLLLLANVNLATGKSWTFNDSLKLVAPHFPPEEIPKEVPKSDTVFVNIKRISFAQIGRLSQNVPINEQGAVLTQDLLQTGAFFKQYGISGSATISKRGADATQTQVLWNGLPINHPMLGMTDFNNFSTFGLSELTFIDGGNSSMYGSGSVGGTVLMNHDADFNKGKIIHAAITLGSFSNHQLAGTIGYSGKKSVIQFSRSALRHQNAFNYFDRTFEQNRKANNSEFNQYISRVLASAQLSKYSQAKVVLELANMYRGLGMLRGSFNSLGNQTDQSLRGILEYKYQKGKFAWIQKFGGSQDDIVYTQSGFKDSSQAQLRFAMSEFYFTINSKTQILTGFDFQQQRGNTRYYQQTQIRNLPAQFISFRQKRNKTQWLASARWEWNERMPSAGLGQETKIGKNCLLKSDLHTSFRRATLNDLYWAQPGNTTLKNETGWEAEAGLVKWNALLNWEMTAFYRELLNPIIWMPAGGLWSARNYFFGRYFGLQSKLKFQSTHFFGHLSADWVRTRVKSHESSDLLQQIFIPDLMSSLQMGFVWKNWKFATDVTHTGNRFIQTDNEEVMRSYQLWDVQINYSKPKKYNIAFEARNILNAVYSKHARKAHAWEIFSNYHEF